MKSVKCCELMNRDPPPNSFAVRCENKEKNVVMVAAAAQQQRALQ